MKIVSIYKPKALPKDLIAFFDLEIGGIRIDGFSLFSNSKGMKIFIPRDIKNAQKLKEIAPQIDDNEKYKMAEILIRQLKDMNLLNDPEKIKKREHNNKKKRYYKKASLPEGVQFFE